MVSKEQPIGCSFFARITKRCFPKISHFTALKIPLQQHERRGDFDVLRFIWWNK
jgi:hypothetical protein